MGASATADVMTLASAQHGAVGVAQLAALGVTAGGSTTSTRRGVLERTAPGVYAVDRIGRRRGTERLTRRAARPRRGARGSATRRPPRLHGLDRAIDDAVEFTVERQAPRTTHAVRRCTRPRRCHAIDRVTVDGFRCLSATRTIIDLARARVPRPSPGGGDRQRGAPGAVGADRAVAPPRASSAGRGRWGARQLDALLVDSGGHSMLERRFLALVREAGLPRPTTQVIHRRDGTTVRPGRLPVRAVRRRRRGLRVGSATARRPSGLATPSGATSCRTSAARVYEYTWEDVTRRPAARRADAHGPTPPAGWRR